MRNEPFVSANVCGMFTDCVCVCVCVCASLILPYATHTSAVMCVHVHTMLCGKYLNSSVHFNDEKIPLIS